MKNTLLCLLALALLCVAALAAPDSLACRMIDWLDAPTSYDFTHESRAWDTYTYEYSGTKNWDLEMGDSVLVWLSGNRSVKYINPWDSTQIDTFFIDSGFVSADLIGCAIDSVRNFVVGDGFVFAFDFRTTYARYWSYMHTPGADYHYAVVEDSFLYTTDFHHGNQVCINVADPESIYIHRTFPNWGGNCGLEVIDGYLMAGGAGNILIWDDPIWWGRPVWAFYRIDMINSDSAVGDTSARFENHQLGDITANDYYVFYVNCEMTDWPDYEIGQSNFYVWDTDTSYEFDARWDGQGVFGVDVIDTHLVAAGFEHGFSVLDIEDLTDIHEVAYYQHIDSVMDFTHFALKENRLYAMGHLDEGGVSTGTVRLWMLELDTASMMQVYEYSPPTPDDFRIRAYPNPFNSAVRISVDAPVGAGLRPARVEIFDIAGRRAAQLPSPSVPLPEGEGGNSFSLWEKVSEGRMRAEFTWRPDATVGSGIYLVRARLDGQTVTKRVVYLK